tara:strand:- start:111 stop:1613 length:1503 start_codon:yes stop_codon:yes gene_type:complete
MQNIIKESPSKLDGTMFKPDIALAVNNMDCGPSNTTGYYNTLVPTSTIKYVLTNTGNPPVSSIASTDSDLVSLVNSLGGSVSTISEALNWTSTTSDYMLTSLVNVTGSTDVLPFAVWDSKSSYSSTEKWYNTLCPNALGGDNKQHALSEWVAMRNADTVKYAAPYSGTRIWEINDSSITEIVTATSSPSRGTFNVTQNRRYVANKPIHLHRNAEQEKLIPLTYCGTQHANYFNRYEPGKIYICALEDNTVVRIYRRDNNQSNPNWIWDQPTTTINITNKFNVQTHTFDSSLDDSIWNYIFSSKPVVITSTSNDTGDRLLTPLAGNIIYQQRNNHYTNMNGVTSGLNGNTYCKYNNDFLYKVASMQIADGSGGDALSGVPTNMLNNNYTFGAQLSDFHIVSGHSSNTIKVYSWNSTDDWTLHETITVTGGTETLPAFVCRDGTQGFGNPCTNDSGGAAYFNNDILWKWEGTETFFISINDEGNDEEALLGWDSGEVKAVFL